MSDSVWPRRWQPPGSPIPGILQARTLEWVAISFSNAGKWKVKVKSLSHVRLLATPWTVAGPGSSVHGISQARILEWVASSFSRGSSQSRDWACISCLAGRFFTIEPPGKSLVPWPGIKPGTPVAEAWSPKHCTVRELPKLSVILSV